jgi:hypothetical protein
MDTKYILSDSGPIKVGFWLPTFYAFVIIFIYGGVQK